MKILLLRSSAIGDVIHTFPAVALIKKELPDAELFTVVQGKVAPLLRNQPIFKKVWELPDHYLYPRNLLTTLETMHQIRMVEFDAVVDFHALVKSSIFFATARGMKIGFDYSGRAGWTSFFANHTIKEPSRHVVEQNYALGAACVKLFKPHAEVPSMEDALTGFPYFHTARAENAVKKWMEDQRLTNMTIITPNTAWPSKHWPASHYKKLIELYNKSILAHRSPLVLLGAEQGAQGSALAQWIEREKIPVHIAPNWDLEVVACLLDKANLVVAPDTGIAHLADFLGISVITFFGPTAPEAHGPRMRAKNQALVMRAPCPHVYQRLHGKTDCMEHIVPEAVMATMVKALDLFAYPTAVEAH